MTRIFLRPEAPLDRLPQDQQLSLQPPIFFLGRIAGMQGNKHEHTAISNPSSHHVCQHSWPKEAQHPQGRDTSSGYSASHGADGGSEELR